MAGKTPSSQQVAQQRARKKVKKVVTEGIAHVHASFNNTIITITDLAHKVLRALVNPLRSPHKLQPNMLVVLLLNMV